MKTDWRRWLLLVILAVAGEPMFATKVVLVQSSDRTEATSPAEVVLPKTGQVEAILLNQIEPASTTVDEGLAQLAQAELVKITNIQIEETAADLTLQLETDGVLAAPETSVLAEIFQIP